MEYTHQKENKILFFWKLCLAVISGIFIAISYPSANYFFCAWFFAIPLLFATRKASIQESYVLGLVAGTSFIILAGEWLGNLAVVYLSWPKSLGILFTIGYAFWYGHIFAFAMLLFNFIKDKIGKLDIFFFPSAFVFVMSLFPEVFRVNFAVTQLDFQSIIQLVEYIGPWGLCWMILFINYFVFKLIIREIPLKSKTTLIVFFCIFCWIAFGNYKLYQWQKQIQSWDSESFGFVQPNRPAVLGKQEEVQGYSKLYPLEMGMTEELAQEMPKVVFWPEGWSFGTYYSNAVLKSFQEKIKKLGVHLVYQDISVFRDELRKEKTYNSVIWMNNQGEIKNVYHKNILMPFGEYAPLAGYFTTLMELFNFSIASFDFGEQFAEFNIGSLRIIPIICYESMIPEYVAESIHDDGKGKFIVVHTQDGWYQSHAQVAQHSQATSMRAVENRVPLLHVINNGFTSLTLPDGTIYYQSPYEQRMMKKIDFPFNSEVGGSFYSAHPYLLINSIRFFVIIVFCIPLFFRKNR